MCQIANFWNFLNLKFFEFSKFEVFGIVQIGKLRNFEIFFNLENQTLAPRIGNFEIVLPFDVPHYSQFCQFSYLPFDMNQFRCFKSLTFIPYSSGNSLDWQIHKIIKFLKLFNFEFSKSRIVKILWIEIFWNSLNWNFLEFSELKFF